MPGQPITITQPQLAACFEEYGGLCVECGEEAFGIDLDACRYTCEACGLPAVYGAEQLVLRGYHMNQGTARSIRRSTYRVIKSVCCEEERIVWLEDLDRGMTITNDAEAVCLELQKDFPGYRIIYKDSDGCWAELRHVAGVFQGFRAVLDETP